MGHAESKAIEDYLTAIRILGSILSENTSIVLQ
jgi:hypothetical protein